MKPFEFLASIRGGELIGLCVLIVAFTYLYLNAVSSISAGRAASLAACALAIMTASLLVKLLRIIRGGAG